MALTFRAWLKYKLDHMVSIQTSIVGGENNSADLTAYAWSGMQVRVHLIGEPVKTRTIKRVLQDANDIGVSTLFLVDSRLLPADGQRTPAQEWIAALNALTHERVYAYRVTGAGAEVIQIHFEEIPSSGELRAWYGPTIPFERIRFMRTAIKSPRSIKGNWMIADFDSYAFWKNTDYRAYRDRRDREQRENLRQRQTHWQTWSNGKTWAGAKSANNNHNQHNERIRNPLQQHLENCYEVLGVSLTSTPEEVKTAFRKRAITYHPDTSALPREQAEAAFRALNEAYDYIKSAHGWS